MSTTQTRPGIQARLQIACERARYDRVHREAEAWEAARRVEIQLKADGHVAVSVTPRLDPDRITLFGRVGGRSYRADSALA